MYPAYFGGYMNRNFEALAEALDLSAEEIKTLCANSFRASFLSEAEKENGYGRLKVFMLNNDKRPSEKSFRRPFMMAVNSSTLILGVS